LLNRISPTAAGQGGFAGADESAGGATEECLGITDVNYVQGQHALAVVDSTLA